MRYEKKGQIALIAVHSDLTVGMGEGAGQDASIRSVGETLACQGWRIDLFTRQASPDQPAIAESAPGCRTIRLKAGPAEFMEGDRLFEHLPEFVESFLQYQQQTQIVYPLLHTHNWLSGWVGLHIKDSQPAKMVHTPHSLGAVEYQSAEAVPPIATTRMTVERACLEKADRVVAASPQEQEQMRSLLSPHAEIEVISHDTDSQGAAQLDQLYLTLLAELWRDFSAPDATTQEKTHELQANLSRP
ncbi:MAG: glycosyltransferase [Elainellaceae cyanobacterium]